MGRTHRGLIKGLDMALRFFVTPPSFSAMFSKGDDFHDFLFAYLEDKDFPKWGLLVKERICSDGSKSFSL